MAAAETTPPGTPSLSDVFNAVVEETLADFPALSGRFLLIDVEEGQIHGLASLPATRFPTIESLEAYLNNAAKTAIETNTSTSRYDPAHDLSVIFFNSAAPQTFGGGPVADALGVIDHELGHLVVPGGGAADTPDASIASENKADLFAAIRHARRVGNSAEDIKLLAFSRAYSLMADGGADAQEHFTTFALMELANTAKTTDLAKMHPQLAVGMADVMAQQYALPAAEVAQMAAAFKGYRDTLAGGGTPEQALKKLAEATLDKNATENTAKLGGFLLDYYLKGKVSLHGQSVKLTGDYWDGVREQLKAREEPPAPSGLIIVPKNFGGFAP